MKKPTVKLTGTDGNVFNVIGLVSAALKKAKQPERAAAFRAEAFAARSYDAVLQLTFNYVEVK